MKELTARELELVAIGAAIASNCIPCIAFHIPQARQTGLTDAQILEAIELADRIKAVPARKVLDAAIKNLKATDTKPPLDCEGNAEPSPSSGVCC
ncbi:MAG TPA: carboxymuconolactone decarboxylase family protein [Fibrobacteria bacterium]|nr:carboxymuconolactone decarboxylase family protein [Fibrobacteria bacterium]